MYVKRRSRTLGASVLATVALAGCSDSIGPSTIAFSTQPTAALAGDPISPPVVVTVRDAFGDPVAGSVAIALDPNPCDWSLSGALVVELSGGIARFVDLSLDDIGRGYTLRASIGSVAAVSTPFTVTSAIVNHPLFHDNLLCTKPNNQSDAESLTWVPEDDAFWIADDERVGVYQVNRQTGATLSSIGRAEFLAALPDAGMCDDGDGDPNTTCSYVNEFEQVVYDPLGKMLYVVNTVNGPSDRPAIFRLLKGTCAGCFTIADWQPLEIGLSYGGWAAVDGELLVSLGKDIYGYDYEANQVANEDAQGGPLPPQYSAPATVVALGYDGSSMWMLTQGRLVYEVRWATKTQVAQYDLGPFSIATPRGIEAIRDTIYVLEGDAPQPINVFTIR